MWRFNRQSDGSYVITNFATGRVLDAYGLGTTDFTNVFTDEYNGEIIKNGLFTEKMVVDLL